MWHFELLREQVLFGELILVPDEKGPQLVNVFQKRLEPKK